MAIELTDGSKKVDWLEGRIYPKARACLQGSDAHSLEFIGRRSTWVRVANINIAGLRQALNDPKARIRFVEEYDPKIGRSFIEKLHISQGFFGNQDIYFNPGLNCIIGGQGLVSLRLLSLYASLWDLLQRLAQSKRITEENSTYCSSLVVRFR